MNYNDYPGSKGFLLFLFLSSDIELQSNKHARNPPVATKLTFKSVAFVQFVGYIQ